MNLKEILKQSILANPLKSDLNTSYGAKGTLYADSRNGGFNILHFALRSRLYDLIDAEVVEAIRANSELAEKTAK